MQLVAFKSRFHFGPVYSIRMPTRPLIILSMLLPTFIACTRPSECNMQECRYNTYELGLYNYNVPAGTLAPTDTMKTTETAFLIFITRFGYGSSKGLGDCQSCTALLTGEKLYSDLDILNGNDTTKAGVNLLDSSLAVNLNPGEPGAWVLRPGVKLKSGKNRFRYQAEMKLKGKPLLSISDTLRFWVDSSVGY